MADFFWNQNICFYPTPFLNDWPKASLEFCMASTHPRSIHNFLSLYRNCHAASSSLPLENWMFEFSRPAFVCWEWNMHFCPRWFMWWAKRCLDNIWMSVKWHTFYICSIHAIQSTMQMSCNQTNSYFLSLQVRPMM